MINNLQEEFTSFPVLYDKRIKGFKEKDAVQNAQKKVAESLDFEEMVILLEQVATENILKIDVLKKLMPCSVSEILTKYWETNSIFADGIFDFDRLTIQNSSFQ